MYNETCIDNETTSDSDESNENCTSISSSPSEINIRNNGNIPAKGLTMESVGALHDNQAFFPSGILSAFGLNEGVAGDALGAEQVDVEGGNMTTSYDVSDESTKMKLETKLRYSWIVIFYYVLPLGDLISDAIITGIVLKS